MNKPIFKQEKCQLMINVSDGEGLEYYYFIYCHNHNYVYSGYLKSGKLRIKEYIISPFNKYL